MLADVLTRRDQQGGHQEHYEGPSVVQLEHNVVDDNPREIELEVLPHRAEGVQHCGAWLCYLRSWKRSRHRSRSRSRFSFGFRSFRLRLQIGWRAEVLVSDGFGALRLPRLAPRNCKARDSILCSGSPVSGLRSPFFGLRSSGDAWRLIELSFWPRRDGHIADKIV